MILVRSYRKTSSKNEPYSESTNAIPFPDNVHFVYSQEYLLMPIAQVSLHAVFCLKTLGVQLSEK